MPARKDETVAPCPARVARIVAQVTGSERKRNGGGAHGQARVTGVGLLDGVGRQESQCVDCAGLKVGFSHEIL